MQAKTPLAGRCPARWVGRSLLVLVAIVAVSPPRVASAQAQAAPQLLSVADQPESETIEAGAAAALTPAPAVPSDWRAARRTRRALAREEADRFARAHTDHPTSDDGTRADLSTASLVAGVGAGLTGLVSIGVWFAGSTRDPATFGPSFPYGGPEEALRVAAGSGAVLAFALGLGVTSLSLGPHRAVEPDPGVVVALYVSASVFAVGGTALAILSAVDGVPYHGGYLVGAVGASIALPLAAGMGVGATLRDRNALEASRRSAALEVRFGVGTVRLAW
jgi:hypothetical protein